MGLLHRRKNKKFEYEPRYYKSSDGSRPFEIKHKFDDHRKTVQKTNFKGKFNNAIEDFRQGSDANVRTRIYVIIVILVALFLWLVDFDLGIFSGR